MADRTGFVLYDKKQMATDCGQELPTIGIHLFFVIAVFSDFLQVMTRYKSFFPLLLAEDFFCVPQ